ncbi:hypothetical protein CDAR_41801 [Caerostris darwini]|uniref:Uncharacterized protein n=1 Tax=Caerostris darwini TaxID=1538125 RepID=A0AAV4WC02_9ARAC|nr:hypothetical protein CDAR_41801 [Caerostris darwini]
MPQRFKVTFIPNKQQSQGAWHHTSLKNVTPFRLGDPISNLPHATRRAAANLNSVNVSFRACPFSPLLCPPPTCPPGLVTNDNRLGDPISNLPHATRRAAANLNSVNVSFRACPFSPLLYPLPSAHQGLLPMTTDNRDFYVSVNLFDLKYEHNLMLNYNTGYAYKRRLGCNQHHSSTHFKGLRKVDYNKCRSLMIVQLSDSMFEYGHRDVVRKNEIHALLFCIQLERE